MTFQDRIHVGLLHEKAVAQELAARGWHVHPWGQGVLSDAVRHAFMDRDSGRDVLLWRWMADLIAVRGKSVVLIDPKSEQRKDTPFFTIELRALMTHLAMKPLGLNTVVVWADMTCNRVDKLRIVDHWLPEPDKRRVTTAGSRTPFARVRKDEQRPLDEFFGPVLTKAA